jgi:hypothetical protein
MNWHKKRERERDKITVGDDNRNIDKDTINRFVFVFPNIKIQHWIEYLLFISVGYFALLLLVLRDTDDR